MKRTVLALIFTLTVLLSFDLQAEGNKEISVLWIGNSYTHGSGMPELLERIFTAKGKVLKNIDATVGGKDWKFHWENSESKWNKEKDGLKRVDFVILQNHSRGPIVEKKREEMFEFGETFLEEIKKRGYKPVLFCPWPRKKGKTVKATVEEDWVLIESAYREIAEKYNVALAPVGQAWRKTIQEKPDLRLYMGDGSHPSPIGAYLTACVFYSMFTNEASDGPRLKQLFSWEVQGDDMKRSRVKVAIPLNDELEAYLQATAWKCVQTERAAKVEKPE